MEWSIEDAAPGLPRPMSSKVRENRYLALFLQSYLAPGGHLFGRWPSHLVETGGGRQAPSRASRATSYNGESVILCSIL
jgi:hypothetical protein